MYNIALIGTTHNEFGKCNSDELYKIIQSIRPDVIFEELGISSFEEIYRKNIQHPNEPLEIKSVKRYLENYTIEHIPVDIDTNEDLLYEHFYSIGDRLLTSSNVYEETIREMYNMTEKNGFEFLNNEQWTALDETKKNMQKKVIELPGNEQHYRIYNQFYEHQDKRENRIIENIYDYSKGKQYEQAILLIGVSHRKSIIEKIEDYNKQENFKLNWSFYGS